MSLNTSARSVANTLQLGLNMVRWGLDNKSQDENLLYCPLGLSLALGMTMNGMEGDTWGQTRDALALGPVADHKGLNSLYGALLSYLTADQLGVKFNLAQGMWADRKVKLEAGFLLANRVFKSELRNCDFANAERVLNHELADGEDANEEGINPWVRRNTFGMIKEILKELTPEGFLVLVSAMAYEGPWAVKFDLGRTYDAEFQGYQDVPMMNEAETNLYLPKDRYELLAKPFAEQRRLHKVVLLPRPGESLADVVSQLKPHDIWELFHQEPKFGCFSYPRHEVATDLLDLIPMLRAFGAKLPFGGGDFSRLTKEGAVKISQIKQKNYQKTHELGGAGGSATAVETAFESCVQGPSPEYYFQANRPYFELLVDRESGAVIFAGVTRQPKPIEAPEDPDAPKAPQGEGGYDVIELPGEVLCSGDYLDGEPEVIGGGRGEVFEGEVFRGEVFRGEALEVAESVTPGLEDAEGRIRAAGVSETTIELLRGQDCLTYDILRDADAHFLVAIGVPEGEAKTITSTFAGESPVNYE